LKLLQKASLCDLDVKKQIDHEQWSQGVLFLLRDKRKRITQPILILPELWLETKIKKHKSRVQKIVL